MSWNCLVVGRVRIFGEMALLKLCSLRYSIRLRMAWFMNARSLMGRGSVATRPFLGPYMLVLRVSSPRAPKSVVALCAGSTRGRDAHLGMLVRPESDGRPPWDGVIAALAAPAPAPLDAAAAAAAGAATPPSSDMRPAEIECRDDFCWADGPKDVREFTIELVMGPSVMRRLMVGERRDDRLKLRQRSGLELHERGASDLPIEENKRLRVAGMADPAQFDKECEILRRDIDDAVNRVGASSLAGGPASAALTRAARQTICWDPRASCESPFPPEI